MSGYAKRFALAIAISGIGGMVVSAVFGVMVFAVVWMPIAVLLGFFPGTSKMFDAKGVRA